MDFFSTEALHPSQQRLSTLRDVGRYVSEALERIGQRDRRLAAAADLLSSVSDALKPGDAFLVGADLVKDPARIAAAYADAAKNGYLVGVTHISFPGLGNLRASADGKSFSWVPLNYSGLK